MDDKYKVLTPYIKFSGDLFALVAVKDGEDIEEIEHKLNLKEMCEGSHLIPVLESNENNDTNWWEKGFSLYIHVLMYG